VFGANVNISGTVHGDVIATAANISVDGTVTGVALAKGMSGLTRSAPATRSVCGY